MSSEVHSRGIPVSVHRMYWTPKTERMHSLYDTLVMYLTQKVPMASDSQMGSNMHKMQNVHTCGPKTALTFRWQPYHTEGLATQGGHRSNMLAPFLQWLVLMHEAWP